MLLFRKFVDIERPFLFFSYGGGGGAGVFEFCFSLVADIIEHAFLFFSRVDARLLVADIIERTFLFFSPVDARLDLISQLFVLSNLDGSNPFKRLERLKLSTKCVAKDGEFLGCWECEGFNME